MVAVENSNGQALDDATRVNALLQMAELKEVYRQKNVLKNCQINYKKIRNIFF
jgi:hypothetical protein